MKARSFSNVRFALAMTALALSGALALASCAGNGDTGGGNGGSGQTSQGGTSGGSGGSTTNPGGNGGSTGTSTCSAGADAICFAGGQASGLMTGYGWIAMGQFNSASAPVCDDTANGGTASDAITKAKPCPSTGGKTVWSTPNNGLCITGSVPKVGTTPGVTGPDYTGYWGLEVGANADTSGGTIDISKYNSVSFTFNDTAVSPAPTGLIRGEIHVKGHTPSDESYCAIVQSGKAVVLSTFNTQCWQGGAGTPISASDMKNVDQIGLQISSDSANDYVVTNFCLSGAAFSN